MDPVMPYNTHTHTCTHTQQRLALVARGIGSPASPERVQWQGPRQVPRETSGVGPCAAAGSTAPRVACRGGPLSAWGLHLAWHGWPVCRVVGDAIVFLLGRPDLCPFLGSGGEQHLRTEGQRSHSHLPKLLFPSKKKKQKRQCYCPVVTKTQTSVYTQK